MQSQVGTMSRQTSRSRNGVVRCSAGHGDHHGHHKVGPCSFRAHLDSPRLAAPAAESRLVMGSSDSLRHYDRVREYSGSYFGYLQ